MQFSNVRSVVAGAVAAVAVIAITGAASGSGVGAIFNLGKVNKVNATSGLEGSTRNPMLSVTNSGAGTALSLQVGRGKAPLSVNSAAQVPDLNASLLGGLAASQFVKGGGQSLSFGLTMSTAVKAQRELLALPGFGTLNAECAPGGGGFASVNFATGAQALDKFGATLDSGQDVNVLGNLTLPPNAITLMASLVATGIANAWEQMILRYTTGSGAALTTHMATVEFMVGVTSTTCDFDASAITGTTG
jgi:hypothetical protein